MTIIAVARQWDMAYFTNIERPQLTSVAVHPHDSIVWAIEPINNQIIRLNPASNVVSVICLPGVHRIYNLCIDGLGTIYVATDQGICVLANDGTVSHNLGVHQRWGRLKGIPEGGFLIAIKNINNKPTIIRCGQDGSEFWRWESSLIFPKSSTFYTWVAVSCGHRVYVFASYTDGTKDIALVYHLNADGMLNSTEYICPTQEAVALTRTRGQIRSPLILDAVSNITTSHPILSFLHLSRKYMLVRYVEHRLIGLNFEQTLTSIALGPNNEFYATQISNTSKLYRILISTPVCWEQGYDLAKMYDVTPEQDHIPVDKS